MRTNRRRFLQAAGTLPLIGLMGRVEAVDNPPKKKIEQAKKLTEGYVKGFSQSLPDDKQERQKQIIEISSETCGALPRREEIDFEKLKNGTGNTHQLATQSIQVAKLLDEHFDHEIPYSTLDDSYRLAKDLAAYAPVIASAQNVVDACCTVEEKQDQKSIKQFYLAVLLFMAEIALFEVGLGYKVAFKSTGYIANLGLVRVRKYVGVRLYALLLSEVHWAIRAEVNELRAELVAKTVTLAIKSKDMKWKDVEKVRNLKEDFLEDPPKVKEKDLEKGVNAAKKHTKTVQREATIWQRRLSAKFAEIKDSE